MTKRLAYNKQTQEARAKGKSNCPLCAVGHDANKGRIYDFDEMDADHVSAWSKGGRFVGRELPDALQDPQSGQG